ncbi:NIF-domain-containing protein [Cutaneotrichosporon oleaginosum]|uniref:NIF-domain-containing protein n=1 Tax=Cutaneotrichosporon oleaginosum TaxID=879819 RepID=A0A0J1AU21_9TREE|nr:NIF-domain-containing protein [Cutaneotrichosporon oleaginosum]KLT38809.1 NIF-domain-containing protein [Cutaneotrichosporon oleaginosum]TXT06209.1 hypothetical protein COLE_05540 [Cutaneotrichosporon oleaginosum]
MTVTDPAPAAKVPEPAAAHAVGATADNAQAPSSSAPAPAPAATKSDAPVANAKPSSSIRASDEKGTSDRSTKPAHKKRRKRGGLAGIFVALGCMSSDEFDDVPPTKATHASANRNAATTTTTTTTTAAAATNTSPAVAKDTTSTSLAAQPASSTAAVAAGAAGVAGVAGATAAAAATAKKADPTTSPAATATKSDSPAVAATPVTGNASSAAVESPITPTRGDSVVLGGGEPTTPPLEETAGLTSGAVQAPGSGGEILHQHMLHRSESEQHLAAHQGEVGKAESSGGFTDLSEDGIDESGHQEMLYGDDEYEDDEDRLIAQGGVGIPIDENGNPAPLLPALSGIDKGRKCLVLDLDETLLHSSFKMLPSADYIVPVEIESQTHNVYVIKRPGVDHFLTEMGKIYEVVVFTASLSKYADPVLDMLDVGRVVRHRLFRESCYNHKGNYVKDLSQLGRDIDKTIIIDNSPASYIFHPNNAVPVSTWFNDPHDTELTDLCPFLADLAGVDDVRGVLDGGI